MRGKRPTLAIALAACLLGLALAPTASAGHPESTVDCEEKTAERQLEATEAFLADGDAEAYVDETTYNVAIYYVVCEFFPIT